jgi:general secretion pathway protein J
MMMRQRNDAAPMAGFTLLEALVAMALMGLILTALATVTSQWLPNWNHGIVRVQRSDQVALGLERLAADIAAAQFIPASDQTRNPFFDGADRSIVFVRTALGPNTKPGLEVVRIAEVDSKQGPFLVRTRAPFVPGIDGIQPVFSDPVVLLRAPYQLSFSYAGTDRSWREDWRAQVQLPNAVKLSVRDATTQRTLSISTATLVHAEIPVDCITARSLAECLASRLRPAGEGDKSRS